MPQLYYSTISINAAQVPSTQTDFPVLVSQTDARFKSTGNGGHVANSSGFDIRPYTDTTLGTAITGYELERYNASTGEVVMWVKVSSLSSSTTPIVLGYGDTSLTTDGSSTTTWSNSFLGVYHLKDGTTLNVDSATGLNNGTNHGATATTGQIDGGGSFVSTSSQYIDCGNGINPSEVTWSLWLNATSFPNSYNAPAERSGTGTNHSGILITSAGKLALYFSTAGAGDISYDGTGTFTLSTGQWYYITATYKSTTPFHLIGYVNASVDKDVSSLTSSGLINAPAASTYIGQDPFTAGRFWNGLIDEVRVASVARSPDWITTEYNNQVAPGTFETLGAEVGVIPISGLYRL